MTPPRGETGSSRWSRSWAFAGSRGLRRLRVGAYRVIYHVDDAQQVATIARVWHRRDVYRGL